MQQRIVEQIVDVTMQRRITPRTLTLSPTCSVVTMRRRRLVRRETSECYVKEFERAGGDPRSKQWMDSDHVWAADFRLRFSGSWVRRRLTKTDTELTRGTTASSDHWQVVKRKEQESSGSRNHLVS